MTTTWAAGFAFNKCHADRKTPYDPHLPSLFDGEEYSKYARLWTRGYDTYTPHRSIVFHDYTHGPKTKDANAWARKYRELQRSHDRLKTLLGMPDATVKRNTSEAATMLGRWDLGNKRSLSQLIEFTGIDTRNYEIDFNNCGKRQWMPFDEGNDDDHMRAQEEQEAAQRTKAIAEEMAAPPNGVGRISRMLEADARQAVDLARPWVERSEEIGARMTHSTTGKVLSGACLLAFVLLIYSCLIATPSKERRSRGRTAGGLIPLEVMEGKGVKIV